MGTGMGSEVPVCVAGWAIGAPTDCAQSVAHGAIEGEPMIVLATLAPGALDAHYPWVGIVLCDVNGEVEPVGWIGLANDEEKAAFEEWCRVHFPKVAIRLETLCDGIIICPPPVRTLVETSGDPAAALAASRQRAEAAVREARDANRARLRDHARRWLPEEGQRRVG